MKTSLANRVSSLEREMLKIRDREIAAYERLIANPYLKEKQRLIGYRLLLLASRTRPQADGKVHLSAAEISNNYRPKPAKGEAWEMENPDGSLPLAQRSTVRGIIKGLVDAGALDVEIGECHRVRENGTVYLDSDFIVNPIGMGDFANRIIQLAGYSRDMSRVPYGTGAA